MKNLLVQTSSEEFLDETTISDLEYALAQSREDIAAGRFVVETPAAHVARILNKVAP